MKTKFWMLAITLCLTVNESLVNSMLAVFVGNYGIVEGFARGFRLFSLDGYLLSLSFRAIPFATLALFIVIFKNVLSKYINIISWCWLISIVPFIAFGYWHAQHSLYTDAHASSTAVIAYIFIPIYAVAVGFASGVLGVICTVIYRQIIKHT